MSPLSCWLLLSLLTLDKTLSKSQQRFQKVTLHVCPEDLAPKNQAATCLSAVCGCFLIKARQSFPGSADEHLLEICTEPSLLGHSEPQVAGTATWV